MIENKFMWKKIGRISKPLQNSIKNTHISESSCLCVVQLPGRLLDCLTHPWRFTSSPDSLRHCGGYRKILAFMRAANPKGA